MATAAPGLLLVAVAYAAGSIPWGYLFGRWFGAVDLRRVGSGGTGATNVQRTLGWPPSIAVLILDALKGFLPVWVGRQWGLNEWWLAAIAVAAVAGHCWSPVLGFRGGKGMATGAGAAAALAPIVLLAFPVVVAAVWSTRYVSLGSLLGSFVAAAGAVVLAGTGRLDWGAAVGIVAMAAIIVVQHRANIQRLRAGTERRLGERAV